MMKFGDAFKAAICCAILFFVPVFSLAATASDSFTVSQYLIGNDTEPPTTPANFTATPVSYDQIDLDWDASSDNIAVDGYQIFRDSTQIATTTLTSYSDTGLTSSTTYAYNIIAFDPSFNYSTSTPVVSTTTLVFVPPVTPTSTGEVTYGTRVRDIEIIDLSYDTTEHSIDLRFTTNMFTRATVRWGRTSSFEGGFVSSDTFREHHKTRIDGLEPGTVYELEIFLTNQRESRELRRTLTIVTDDGPDTEPPPNASDFVAVLQDEGVALSWKNPVIPDFAHIRVLSSDYFYPTHIADGWLVYEGDAESAFDARSLSQDSRRYYTIFVYDTAGNTSSGAVTSVVRGQAAIGREDPATGTSTDAATETPPPFIFDDLRFFQNGEERPSFAGTVELQASEDTRIELPYELTPEHLKTIVVTLAHPNDPEKVFSFLLRINPEKTAYEARIGPLRESGTYPLSLELFDFTTKRTAMVEGTVIVKQSAIDAILQTDRGGIFGYLKEYALLSLLLLLLLLLLLVMLVRYLTRREEETYQGKPL